MQALAIALVSLLILPVSVVAPLHVDAQEVATTTVAATTTKATIINVAHADTKSAPAPLTVKLTAYNAVPSQTDGNPFVTASGAFSNPEVVAARSNDLAAQLPFGTVISIERLGADSPMCNYTPVASQIGYRVIADSMNTRIHNTVDVLLDQNNTVPVNGRMINPGRALGVCGQTTVRIVGRIKVSEIPDTQAKLTAKVNSMLNPTDPTLLASTKF